MSETILTTTDKKNSIQIDSVSKLEKYIEDFDKNIKIIDFYLQTETLYDINKSKRNIKNLIDILEDCSRYV